MTTQVTMRKIISIKIIMGWSILAAIGLTSCDKKDTPKPIENNTTTLTVNTVKNLPANPTDGTGTGHYTFFSFKNNTIIPFSDSTTINWDIAFNATTLIINGGTSGSGIGAAQVYTGIFSDLLEAPTEEYKQDNNKSLPPNAIPTGSGNGWYNYNSTTHVISAIPGRVLVIKTAQGKYAKVEIISYYKDLPTNPSSADIARYYTFRYAYQDNGSKQLY